jgi:BioD-like phosphotransacetylase family protein
MRPSMVPGSAGTPEMGRGATMGSGMMQGGMAQMMPMMGMMEMIHSAQHIEGRLAFAKAELKITGVQEQPWNDFADAMRQAAAKAHESGQRTHSMSGMAGNTTPMQLLEQHEKQLAARLEAIRIVKPALEPLYASLSEEQKKTFGQVHMIFHGVI